MVLEVASQLQFQQNRGHHGMGHLAAPDDFVNSNRCGPQGLGDGFPGFLDGIIVGRVRKKVFEFRWFTLV